MKKQYLKMMVKKMPCHVDNFSEYDEKRVQLYNAVQEYNSAGYSKRQIAIMLHCSRNTVTKYLDGNYEALCKKEFPSGMDRFYDYIIKSLRSGISRKDVYLGFVAKGYEGGKTAAYDYMNKIVARFQIDIAVYKNSSYEAIQKKKAMQKYPVIRELMCCIREFREIYKKSKRQIKARYI